MPSSEVDFQRLSDRIKGGIDALPNFAAEAILRDLGPVLGSDGLEREMAVRAQRAVLRSVTQHYGTYAPRGIDRSPSGKPLPPFAAKFEFIGFTDCVDPETSARIAMEEQGLLTRLGVPSPYLNWSKTEPLNPASVRANVTSSYYTHCQKQNSNPQRYDGQLIILGNSAPRDPSNPDAKGCPFVLAVLEQDVFYLGTLNPGGVELQGVRPYVKEIWHTTLGIEQAGTEGGKNPVGVFRSKGLLPLFEGLVEGDDTLLDRALDPNSEITPIDGIQIDARDSFGNLKTTMRFSELLQRYAVNFGDQVELTVGEVSVPARIAHSHGDGLAPCRSTGRRGEVLIVPGSSPDHPSNERLTRADIVMNSGDASQCFLGNQNGSHERWAGLPVLISKD